jgi:hypothetical protein
LVARFLTGGKKSGIVQRVLFERRCYVDIVQVFSGVAQTSDRGLMEERGPIGNVLFPKPLLHGTPDSVEKEKSRFNHIGNESVIIPHFSP